MREGKLGVEKDFSMLFVVEFIYSVSSVRQYLWNKTEMRLTLVHHQRGFLEVPRDEDALDCILEVSRYFATRRPQKDLVGWLDTDEHEDIVENVRMRLCPWPRDQRSALLRKM